MKILFTGGGSGGHFYPIIAVAEALREQVRERKILSPQMYYMAPTAYSPRALFDNDIEFISIPAGKLRRYFSFLNFTDLFKTLTGCIMATIKLYSIYPDVIFSKGGYAGFPVLVAAKILKIPVIIHESDSKPGRVNKWSSRFAKRIAISYAAAAPLFGEKNQEKIAFTGNPIRPEIMKPIFNEAHEFLKLEEKVPTLVVLGGSQGASKINDVIIEAMPDLLNRYQIIHQTGRSHLSEIKSTSGIILKDHPYAYRYHPLDYLNELTLRMAAGVADIIISRAGSVIFEIATWGIPSIIIPLPESISHDQTSNARAYASSGAASLIKEENLRAHILTTEIDHIYMNQSIKDTMKRKALEFAKQNSASTIADAILDIALEHEQ